MTTKFFDAIFIGVATIDTLALVEEYPSADSRTLTDHLERAGGGVSATAAVAAARLGKNVAFAGVVGNDSEGQEVIAGLKSEGVNTDLIVIDQNSKTATSAIVVAKSTATRAIITRQHINYSACVTAELKKAIENAQIVHFDHAGYPLIQKLPLKRNFGPKISLDHGNKIANFDPSLIDIYTPSDLRLSELFPTIKLADAVKSQASKFQQDVIVTAGGNGSYAVIAGNFTQAPAVEVEIVSTLGAGDVFHGALVAQYLEGRSPTEMLIRANAVAGLSCRGLDGRSAIPTKTELEEFLTTN
jgi:sulfofructose kinase